MKKSAACLSCIPTLELRFVGLQRLMKKVKNFGTIVKKWMKKVCLITGFTKLLQSKDYSIVPLLLREKYMNNLGDFMALLMEKIGKCGYELPLIMMSPTH